MAPSTARPPSLSRGSLRRQSSTIRTGCANERPSGSARGVPRKRYPYRDLGVQGSTGTLSAANRQQIAQNLQGIQGQLVQLANTSVGGSYLFGGTATTAPPYTLDSASPSGVTYNGNSGTNTVQIADGLNLQTNMPGNQLFQNSGGDIFGSLQQLITALQSGTAAAAETATNQLRTAFDSLTSQRIFYGNAVHQLNSTQTFLQQEQ